jgi:hypothetical protein
MTCNGMHAKMALIHGFVCPLKTLEKMKYEWKMMMKKKGETGNQ